VLLNPFTVPTVTCADDVPPGATASSDSGPACRVKLCADAPDGKARKAPNKHKAETTQYALRVANHDFNQRDCNTPNLGKEDLNKKDLNKKDFTSKDFNASDFCDSDGDDSDFNMSRFRFN